MLDDLKPARAGFCFLQLTYTKGKMMTVVFMMLDGLRPDAIEAAASPNLQALMRRGAYTLRATSVMPSVTLPCHTSIFHSVPPTRHGITTNDWVPMARPVPGLVDVAKNAGRRCAFFYNWEPLRNLSQPGSLWCSYYREAISTAIEGDRFVADEAARVIANDRPDFAFIYFGTIDLAGHDYGWMSEGYLRQIEQVDALFPTVLGALGDEDYVLVHSDHGGHERMHGFDVPEDMTIPWIIAGPNIRQNYAVQSPVSLLDTAPTLARLLGLQPPPVWEGRAVEEIFAS
jgi:arylsulfatase A-like enzyme